jgi:hypothetical protein
LDKCITLSYGTDKNVTSPAGIISEGGEYSMGQYKNKKAEGKWFYEDLNGKKRMEISKDG